MIFPYLLNAKIEAQVGIGTTSMDASAKLQVDATNKGFLPPRVSLTATNDAITISNPATGLLVYNMATAGSSPNNVSPGYYYYSGTSWIRLIIPTDQVAGVKGTVTLVDGTAIPSASSIDNFNLGDYSFFKITGIVTSNINGFSNGVEGRLIVVLNSIDRNQTFMQEAITSTSSNRFVLGVSNLTLAINRTATFIYSSGLTVNSVSGQSRWVLIAH